MQWARAVAVGENPWLQFRLADAVHYSYLALQSIGNFTSLFMSFASDTRQQQKATSALSLPPSHVLSQKGQKSIWSSKRKKGPSNSSSLVNFPREELRPEAAGFAEGAIIKGPTNHLLRSTIELDSQPKTGIAPRTCIFIYNSSYLLLKKYCITLDPALSFESKSYKVTLIHMLKLFLVKGCVNLAPPSPFEE